MNDLSLTKGDRVKLNIEGERKHKSLVGKTGVVAHKRQDGKQWYGVTFEGRTSPSYIHATLLSKVQQ